MTEREVSVKHVKEFLKQAEAMTDAFIVASLTDEYIVDDWPEMKGMASNGEENMLAGKEDKVLEIRIFNEEEERKLFRGDIGKHFHERRISDNDLKEDYYDESQLLDIDKKRSEESFLKTGRVRTMGGGSYYLPLQSMEDARVLVRYYLSRYENSGQARVCDWRLVKFQNGKGKEGEKEEGRDEDGI